MPIDIVWDDPHQTIILITFVPLWTWEQFNQAVATSHAMRASVDHKVAAIFDFSEVVTLPSGALGYFRREYRNLQQNDDTLVVIGANPLVRSVGNMVASLTPRRRKVFFVDTKAEARALLADLRLNS